MRRLFYPLLTVLVLATGAIAVPAVRAGSAHFVDDTVNCTPPRYNRKLWTGLRVRERGVPSWLLKPGRP